MKERCPDVLSVTSVRLSVMSPKNVRPIPKPRSLCVCTVSLLILKAGDCDFFFFFLYKKQFSQRSANLKKSQFMKIIKCITNYP